MTVEVPVPPRSEDIVTTDRKQTERMEEFMLEVQRTIQDLCDKYEDHEERITILEP